MLERKDVKTHCEAINALIAQYCKDNGLVFSAKSITYSGAAINYKCEVRTTDKDGNVALSPWDKAAIAHLIEDAPADVKDAPTVIGRYVHLLNDKVAKILGYDRKRPKYCWRVEYYDGKVVLVPNHMIMWNRGFAA